MARSIEEYLAEVAPNQPFGYADERGLVRFRGLGLDPIQGAPVRGGNAQVAVERPRNLFSDLNQWLLKVRDDLRPPANRFARPRTSPREAGWATDVSWGFDGQ
jgi:hypothetical protein